MTADLITYVPKVEMVSKVSGLVWNKLVTVLFTCIQLVQNHSDVQTEM